MKVYLASRFGRQAEMRALRSLLYEAGFGVVSRWLDEEWSTARGEPVTDDHRLKWSGYDFEDVASCDVMLNFTEPPGGCGSGGRHVEMGLALAWGKRCIVVGHRENVFHYLPQVEFCETLGQALELLKEIALCPR
jgi:hypothetical protein